MPLANPGRVDAVVVERAFEEAVTRSGPTATPVANESAADNYSFDLLTERKLERKGLVSAFDKLAKLSGGATGSSLMSSHPPSAERSARMQKRLDAAK